VAKVPGYALRFGGPAFNEFVVACGRRKPADVNRALWGRKILGGVELGRYYPELADCLLCCVTELHSREQIDGLAAALAAAPGAPARAGAAKTATAKGAKIATAKGAKMAKGAKAATAKGAKIAKGAKGGRGAERRGGRKGGRR
jgi:hypothetical protein